MSRTAPQRLLRWFSLCMATKLLPTLKFMWVRLLCPSCPHHRHRAVARFGALGKQSFPARSDASRPGRCGDLRSSTSAARFFSRWSTDTGRELQHRTHDCRCQQPLSSPATKRLPVSSFQLAARVSLAGCLLLTPCGLCNVHRVLPLSTPNVQYRRAAVKATLVSGVPFHG